MKSSIFLVPESNLPRLEFGHNIRENSDIAEGKCPTSETRRIQSFPFHLIGIDVDSSMLNIFIDSFAVFTSFLGRYFQHYGSGGYSVAFSPQLTKESRGVFDSMCVVVVNLSKDISFEEVVEEFEVTLKKSRFTKVSDLVSKSDNSLKEINVAVFTKDQFDEVKKNENGLDIVCVIDNGHISLILNENVFCCDSFVKEFLINFEVFAKSAFLSRRSSIFELDIMPSDQRDYILNTLNQTSTIHLNESRTLNIIFEESCKKFRNHTAIEYLTESITYHHLNERINQLYHHLKKVIASIKVGDFLGVCLEKSIELIVCIITCWKLGCVYFPIEPKFPENRINFLLEDTKCHYILCGESTVQKFNFLPENSEFNIIKVTRTLFSTENDHLLNKDNPNPPIGLKSSSLAYISYTSGSSGTPKSVIHEHQGAWCIYSVLPNRLGMKCPGDRILLFSSISFDEHLNTLSTLFHGSTVVICPEEVRYTCSTSLWNFIDENEINTIKLTPSVLQSLPQKKFSSVDSISIIGEVCAPSTMDFWSEQTSNFIHLYGSQETILDHSKKWKQGDIHGNVGKPFENMKCYVLDQNLSPVPMGVAGQVFLSGPPIKRGYYQRPKITKQKFILNPFSSSQHHKILYSTGDYGYLLPPDGDLVFSRRIDRMIKIHGMRMELGEIEEAIKSSKMIEKVFVGVKYVKKNLRKILVAFLILKCTKEEEEEEEEGEEEEESDDEEDKNEIELRKYLSKELPYYMIPHLFIYKKSFPLTVSKKMDVQKLMDFDVSKYIRQYYVPATSEDEKKMKQIFKEVLFDDDEEEYEIGIMDDFHTLGGTSLSLLVLVRKIGERFLVKINYVLFLQITDLTIKNLCYLLFHTKSSNLILLSSNEMENRQNFLLSEETKRFLREFDEKSEVMDMSNGKSGILYRLMKYTDLEECIDLDIRAWHSINPLYLHTKISEEEDKRVTKLFLTLAISEGTSLVAIDLDKLSNKSKSRTSINSIIMINGGYSNEGAEECCSKIPEEISMNSPNRPIGALYSLAEKNIPKEDLIEPILNAGSLAGKIYSLEQKQEDSDDDDGDNINFSDVMFKMELLLQLIGQKKGYKTFLDDPNSPVTQEYARRIFSSFPGVKFHNGIKFDDFEWPEGSGKFPLCGMREGYIRQIRNTFGEVKAKEIEKIKFDSLFYVTRDWRKKLLE